MMSFLTQQPSGLEWASFGSDEEDYIPAVEEGSVSVCVSV